MSAGGIGTIRTGIGGWTYEPWRGTFYPADLPKAKEADYAVSHLGTIEINGTFYRTQTPATFAKWRDAAPDGFVYAVKALQYCVAKKKLAEAEDSIGRFLASGPERARRQVRTDPLAVPRDAQVRSRGYRRVYEHVAGQDRRGDRPAMSSRRGTRASPARSSSNWRAGKASPSSSPTMRPTRRSPTRPPISSMRG